MGIKSILMNEKRIAWIDVCKCILIVTIVIMHIDFPFWKENVVGQYISRLASLYDVTIFFCIAGLTLKEEKLNDTKNFIINKISKLYLKIVVVGLIAVALHNVFIDIGFYKIGIDYSGKIMKSYEIVDFIKQAILTLLMANREVIIGPMWFANVLFMALVLLALINWIVRKIVKNENYRYVRFVITLFLMLISSFLTNVVDITIPRFNNTLTAVFLIDLCQLLYTKLNLKFNNVYMFITSFVILLSLPFYGSFSLNQNQFINPAFLIVESICGMYMFFYISKKLSTTKVNRILTYVGSNSFYIMALHLVSFKICSMIIWHTSDSVLVWKLTPKTTNIMFLIFYVLFGSFVPCAIGSIVNRIKKTI